MKQLVVLTTSVLVVLLFADLSAAQKPELVVQTGHADQISAVVFSPDGNSFATGSWDQTVKIWDLNGNLLRTFAGHTGQVSSVAFSPNGSILASGGWDHTVNLWNVQTGELVRKIVIRRLSQFTDVAFSPDGKILAGSTGEGIYLWETASGADLQSIWEPQSPKDVAKSFGRIAFSHDGRLLAGAINSGSLGTVIKLWDLTTETEKAILERRSTATNPPIAKATLAGHTDQISALLFSADDKTLISGSWDKTVRLWDVASGKVVQTVSNGLTPVLAAANSQDGKWLAFASTGLIRLFDLEKRELSLSIKAGSSAIGENNAVAFSPDGKRLVGALRESKDHFIKSWDVKSGAELFSLLNKQNRVKALAFASDGKRLVMARRDLKVWEATQDAPRTVASAISDEYEALAISPDGETVATQYDDYRKIDFGIKLWDLSNDEKSFAFPAHGNSIRALAFSSDGKKLISRSWDDSIAFWDTATGKKISSVKIFSRGAGNDTFALTADGNTLAINNSQNDDKTITLLRASDGSTLRTLVNDKSFEPWTLAFAADGKLLAGGGYGEIRVWNTDTGAVVHLLKGHNGRIYSLAFSPNGKWLASGGDDKTVRIWSTTDGRLVHTFSAHSAEVNAVSFNRDSSLLATGSSDTTVKLWDPEAGRELATLMSIGKNDWIVITPDGLFDGSPAAWKKILWRYNHNTFDVTPVEAYFTEFYYPGLLDEIMAGKRPTASAALEDKDRRRIPVKLSPVEKADSVTPVTARTVRLQVEVEEAPLVGGSTNERRWPASGAGDVRLFRNGSLVKFWRGDLFDSDWWDMQAGETKKLLTEKEGCVLQPRREPLDPERNPRRSICTVTVPIVEGENRFTAYAFNHDNIKSSDAELIVTGADSLRRLGTAYVLAIGVNNYANEQYNLKYAVADAEDFAAEVKRQQESLKHYAKVEVISLADTQATKANITQKLNELAKQVQPEDAVIVFFAGHGTANKNKFYLIPHDLGYDGPRENLSKAGLQAVLDHSISDRELEKLFELIDAGQLLLVIDACNSGQALEAEEKRRGPMNSKGLAQLAYEKGMYVLTAAQSYQAAQEAEKFGHGFLTYALVEEGLKQGAADREPKNGSIDIREWLNFATDEVPKMQENNSREALRGRGRFIVFIGDGTRMFDRDKKAEDNVQRPRVFYRRELETNPLVMGATNSTSPK